MNKAILDEVIACLPTERTVFHYFKGQYAFNLLSYATKKQESVSAIKRSPFQSLLNQPDVKTLLSGLGSGQLSPALFEYAWQASSQPFVLTVAGWGDSNQWNYQTSRKGCNLVLQLNFSEQHNQAYQRLVKPEDDYVFNFSGHPVLDRTECQRYRNTLAWSRIDIDLTTGEALIEEVQSDWVRRVKYCLQALQRGERSYYLDRCNCKPEQFIEYAKNIMQPYNSVWAEAMLMATVEFIYKELGINKIYYHTYETGAQIKQVFGGAPPRSLYSDLPKKFCFQMTRNDPTFIKTDRYFLRKKRRVNDPKWYLLTL